MGLSKRGGHGGEQNRVGPECNEGGIGIALSQRERIRLMAVVPNKLGWGLL